MTAIIVVLLFAASMAGVSWAVHVAKEDPLPHSRSHALKKLLEKAREK